MKHKLLAGLLAVLMLCALIPMGAAAATFTDVPEAADYSDAVEWAVSNSITNGTSATTFSPEMICTRGQVVTFLWRSMGCPEPATAANPFTDVAPGSYCEKAVLWAVENGITNGTSAVTFSPDLTCTCGHILTFLWRTEGAPETGASGPVAARFPANWYTDAVKWAEYQGLMRGSESVFDVDAPCTRAMTVTYLYLVMLNESPLASWNPTVIQRQVIFDAGSMCGVVYLGGFTAREDAFIYDRDFWDQAIADSGLAEDYPFLMELPNENIVQTAYGNDVFLIIPLDPGAAVSVLPLNWIEHDVKGYMYTPGEAIYHSYFGQPILLCCNQSDIRPDVMVRIIDSEGKVMEWQPFLSLENGRVDVRTESGPAVYDLTQYPEGYGA